MYERFFKNKIKPMGAVIINMGIITQPRYFPKYSIPVTRDNFDVVINRLSTVVRISSSDVWKYCADEPIILENTDVSGFVLSVYGLWKDNDGYVGYDDHIFLGMMMILMSITITAVMKLR